MAFAIRCVLYLGGGGVLLAWIRPPRGVFEVVAVLAWIGVCTAVDSLLGGAMEGGRLASGPQRKPRRARGWGAGGAGREGRESAKRQGLPVVFTSHDVAEAEALSAQLRDRGLRPMLVTQRSGSTGEDVTFEVRVSKDEWRRALPVIARFSSR